VLLLISDANILMDVEEGDLVVPMFSLSCKFAVPDILYVDELHERHAYLLGMGLQTMTLSEQSVACVEVFSRSYRRPSRNDLFALALAQDKQCPLLTGDAALRKAAESEQVAVRGTVWLIEEMIREKRITVAIARVALNKMRLKGRRLPWEKAEEMLIGLDSGLDS